MCSLLAPLVIVFFFLLQSFTVLMKQTRQPVHTIRQSIYLDVYGWDRLQISTVAGSLNKRLMLSSSFRCDQIYKYEIYNSGHTLLCSLSPTQMFNKPYSEAGLLNKMLMLISSFRCDQIYKYELYDFGHT